MADANSTSTAPPAWRRWLPAAVILVALGAVLAFRLDRYFTFETLAANRHWLKSEVDRLGAAAPLLYILVYAAAVALSIPGALVLTLAGGFLFGTVAGSIYIVLGATAGAVLIFLVARTALGETLRRRAGPFARKLEAGFRCDAFSYLLTLRLVPVFPFWLVNLVPALLGVRLGTFTLATFLGIIPATVVYASIGSGLGAVFDRGEHPNLGIILEPRFLLPLLGLALLALAPIAYKRWRRRRAAENG